MHPRITVLIFACALALGACQTTGQHESAYGYHGNAGPEHWCGLNDAYAVCCQGQMQSPVNIDTATTLSDSASPQMQLHYDAPVDSQVIHNGHTVQVNILTSANAASPRITVDGVDYTLLQFHFHTPSEHAIDGNRTPVEMHLVHKAQDGRLAVVGVLLTEGPGQAELARVIEAFPTGEGAGSDIEAVNVVQLLPPDTKAYTYAGSLTTPPCTEGVNWIVMAAPLTISTSQIGVFASLFSGREFPHGNARPLQPLNNRRVSGGFVQN